jgi:hypothetical protein
MTVVNCVKCCLPLQVLQIIVMDEDLVSFQDKVIGVAQIPLKTVSTTEGQCAQPTPVR